MLQLLCMPSTPLGYNNALFQYTKKKQKNLCYRTKNYIQVCVCRHLELFVQTNLRYTCVVFVCLFVLCCMPLSTIMAISITNLLAEKAGETHRPSAEKLKIKIEIEHTLPQKKPHASDQCRSRYQNAWLTNLRRLFPVLYLKLGFFHIFLKVILAFT